MKETTNYKLGLWESRDEVGREGINDGLTAVDAALGLLAGQMSAGLEEKAVLVTGTYLGNGNTEHTIQLGFTPRAVILCNQAGRMGGDGFLCGGSLLPGGDLQVKGGSYPEGSICEGGFYLHTTGSDHSLNGNGYRYHYVALR